MIEQIVITTSVSQCVVQTHKANTANSALHRNFATLRFAKSSELFVSPKMMNMKIETEAKLFAIKYGAITLDEIIKWADDNIQSNTTPDPNFIELSLAKTMGEAVSALNEFGFSDDKTNVSKLILEYFYESLTSGRSSYEAISKAIYDMALEGYFPGDGTESEMFSYWDELDLAIIGSYGDPEEVKARMLEFIQKNKG